VCAWASLIATLSRKFYEEHKGKPFFDSLIEYMSSGPCAALILSKENAIQDWRELMGPTKPDQARIEKPKSIRALFGTDTTRNACHGSDSPKSAEREIAFFFPS